MAGGKVKEKMKWVLQKIKLFAFKINYNTLDNNQTDVKKLYNGNIAETRWRTNFDNLTRSYGYTYDALNRLTNAQYVRPSNPNNPNAADIIDTFNEKLSYDKNGNIQTLVRNGGMESQTTVPVMDNLVYQYDTNTKNKLIKVTDITANTDGFKDGANTPEEYGYDPNGNMTRDDNKNIQSIVYNHLNLPTKIVFQNGGDFPSISYLYTATGKKVAKTVNIASRRPINYNIDYLDGYQYESGKLLFFPTAEGYVKYTESARNPFDYIFNYTDHLGNVRLSYGVNPGTGLLTKIEENNYYPFGLKHATYNNTAKMIAKVESTAEVAAVSGKFMVQKIDVLAEEMERPPMEMPPGGMIDPMVYSGYNYKFEGREYQDELGLNVYPFKYRTYDPAIGRFWSIDPVAESYVYNGVYNFAENRVVESIDLEGKESWFVQDGSLATKAGPYTSQARQKLNLYSPSEVQQMKAQRANNTGPMLSQDRLSPQQRNNQERLAKTTPTSTSTPSKESTSKTSAREKVAEAAKGVSEVAEKTSTATKVAAVIVGTVAAVTGQEYIVPAAVDAYMGGVAIGTVGQGAEAVSLAAKGDGKGFVLESTSIFASELTGGMVNTIPGVSDVTKATAKTAAEAAINAGKEKAKEELEKH